MSIYNNNGLEYESDFVFDCVPDFNENINGESWFSVDLFSDHCPDGLTSVQDSQNQQKVKKKKQKVSGERDQNSQVNDKSLQFLAQTASVAIDPYSSSSAIYNQPQHQESRKFEQGYILQQAMPKIELDDTSRYHLFQSVEQNDKTSSSSAGNENLKEVENNSSGEDDFDEEDDSEFDEEENTDDKKRKAFGIDGMKAKVKNREHAKNTRMRKKNYIETLKDTVRMLADEREKTDRERRIWLCRLAEQVF